MQRYGRILHLLFWTIRYLVPSQVWYRARRTLRQRWWRLRKTHAPGGSAPPLRATTIFQGLADVSESGPWRDEVADEVNHAVSVARGLAHGEFCFLNQRVQAEAPPWKDTSLPRLWIFHLLYFDYVTELLVQSAQGERAAAYATFKKLAQSWMESHQRLGGDGWHPYTLSLRIVNWLYVYAAFEPELASDGAFAKQLRESLWAQARALASDLERDVRGNHLLENVRALIWAGLSFDDPAAGRWFDQALAILRAEIKEQIQPDGGHFERSPGYHVVVLKDFLEIALWLRLHNKEVPDWLDDALRRMCDYLVAILPPDGQTPLLKDTAWDAAPVPADVLAAAALYFNEPRWKISERFGLYPLMLFGVKGQKTFESWPVCGIRASQALKESGHYVLRDDARGDFLIFDAGKVCPDYLPGHAHADLLSYELMVGGQRVIVDSGVYQYEAGIWRDYFRSTRAHNTVEVAGEDQSEMWGSFRVARRARPRGVVWRETEDGILVGAEHDGYARLKSPVIHRRSIIWRPEKFWLVFDELHGTEPVSAKSFIHLHPDFGFTSVAKNTWCIENGKQQLWLTLFGYNDQIVRRAEEAPRQGWYSSQFGELLPNWVLELQHEGALPHRGGYVIAWGEAAEVLRPDVQNERSVTIRYNNQDYVLSLGEK